jgi:predicted amidophosphoribosyltransferase
MDGLVALFAYREGIQVAVKRLKYRFVREMGEAFVDLAHKRIESSVVSYFQREVFRVVPVPLFRTRERRRGYNQAAVLGELLAIQLGLDFAPVLVRVKNTQALAEFRVRLSSNEEKAIEEKYLSLAQRRVAQWKLLAEKKSRLRADEIRGAFRIHSKFEIRNSKILLVDDVWTSGGTMLECAKTLKRVGASRVWGLAFSRGGR